MTRLRHERQCAYYGNARLTPREMKKGHKRDGDVFRFAVLFNNEILREPALRKLLEEEYMIGITWPTMFSRTPCRAPPGRWPGPAIRDPKRMECRNSSRIVSLWHFRHRTWRYERLPTHGPSEVDQAARKQLGFAGSGVWSIAVVARAISFHIKKRSRVSAGVRGGFFEEQGTTTRRNGKQTVAFPWRFRPLATIARWLPSLPGRTWPPTPKH